MASSMRPTAWSAGVTSTSKTWPDRPSTSRPSPASSPRQKAGLALREPDRTRETYGRETPDALATSPMESPNSSRTQRSRSELRSLPISPDGGA